LLRILAKKKKKEEEEERKKERKKRKWFIRINRYYGEIKTIKDLKNICSIILNYCFFF
jgi:hypothetical protein